MLTKLKMSQERDRVSRQVCWAGRGQVSGQIGIRASRVIRQQIFRQVVPRVRDSILSPLQWEARSQDRISRPN